jgi:hypothetical protein
MAREDARFWRERVRALRGTAAVSRAVPRCGTRGAAAAEISECKVRACVQCDGGATMPRMKELMLVAALFGALSSLRAQCVCQPTTTTNNPLIAVIGPPAWQVGGTIQDVGTIHGVCPREGCENPRPCGHNLLVDIYVTFPAASDPVPVLTLVLKTSNQFVGSFPIQPSSAVANANGTNTFHYAAPMYFDTPCDTGSGSQSGTFELQWTPPGGGAPTSSGSVTMTCSRCG